MVYNIPMKITPYRDIVLIKADKPKDKTASGILIVEDWKTLPPLGTVEAIGPDVKNKDILGKHVMFERYSSIVLPKQGDDEYRFCNEASILAEVEDAA